jgi:hypothetical protein
MAANTRSSSEVWLIGKATNELSSSRLATNGDVLRCLLFYHLEEHLTVKESIKRTIQQLTELWERAKIPTHRFDSGKRKLKKLYDGYLLLKKGSKTDRDSLRIRQQMFKDDLLDLFDYAAKNVMETMTNSEDKQFLDM